MTLNHLSGGQKAVVAVALLFALQKVDPAPFYIFDEFDCALDVEYRYNIAALIAEFSRESQFLITTFKPELIEAAQKIFEVGYRAKNSFIEVVDKVRAKEIIKKVVEEDKSE